MRKLCWTLAWAGVAIVTVAAAAFLWWADDGPEAVDMEAAAAQLEAASLDGIEALPTTRLPEDAGMTSITNMDDATATEVGVEAETADAYLGPAADYAPRTDPVAGTQSTSVDHPPVTQPADDVGVTSGKGSDASVTMSDADADGAEPTEAGAGETTSTNPAEAFAGLWTVATPEGEGLPGEPAVSFAGFRVVEVLMGGVAESTAVGRTADLAGSIELEGANLVSARVEVVLATLRTDNSHRDSHMRQALNTNEYPMAVFTLAKPVELPIGVFQEETFSGTVLGHLTIKGVTNRALFDLKARVVGNTIVAVGSSEVVFGDYGVPTPTSASVISVEDHGTIEFLLYFTR